VRENRKLEIRKQKAEIEKAEKSRSLHCGRDDGKIGRRDDKAKARVGPLFAGFFYFSQRNG
jgi:hypothetical protein